MTCIFVKNSKIIRLREKWRGNPKKWGKNCLALIFYIIKIKTEKSAWGAVISSCIFRRNRV